MKTQITPKITVEISGNAASLWRKNGKNRIYFTTENMRFVDLDALARDPKFELPTNIRGFKADTQFDGKLYRVCYTGNVAASRGTEVIIKQEVK